MPDCPEVAQKLSVLQGSSFCQKIVQRIWYKFLKNLVVLGKFVRFLHEWYALKQGVGKQIILKKNNNFFKFFKEI
jgi:hypothetical protein